MGAPSLEAFKSRLGRAVSNLLYWKVSLNWMISKIPFSTNHSVTSHRRWMCGYLEEKRALLSYHFPMCLETADLFRWWLSTGEAFSSAFRGCSGTAGEGILCIPNVFIFSDAFFFI